MPQSLVNTRFLVTKEALNNKQIKKVNFISSPFFKIIYTKKLVFFSVTSFKFINTTCRIH